MSSIEKISPSKPPGRDHPAAGRRRGADAARFQRALALFLMEKPEFGRPKAPRPTRFELKKAAVHRALQWLCVQLPFTEIASRIPLI